MTPSRYHRPATAADAYLVAKHLRAADAQECWTAAGRHPIAVLGAAVRHRGAETILSPAGDPIGLCGVHAAPEDPSVGIVWMCGTDAVARHRRLFFTEGRAWLDRRRRPYGRLVNHVDARNTLHVRWLALLGFRFTGIHAVAGHPFILFESSP